MKLIKTSQFSFNGHKLLDDAENKGYSEALEEGNDILGDLVSGLENAVEEVPDALDGMDDQTEFMDDTDGMDDAVDHLMEDHPDGDISFEIELDAPNDISDELPVDISVDSDAFEGDGIAAEIAIEPEFDGFDDDAEIGDESMDFDGLSFDGSADGEVDFDNTNDTKPDSMKGDPFDFDDGDENAIHLDLA